MIALIKRYCKSSNPFMDSLAGTGKSAASVATILYFQRPQIPAEGYACYATERQIIVLIYDAPVLRVVRNEPCITLSPLQRA